MLGCICWRWQSEQVLCLEQAARWFIEYGVWNRALTISLVQCRSAALQTYCRRFSLIQKDATIDECHYPPLRRLPATEMAISRLSPVNVATGDASADRTQFVNGTCRNNRSRKNRIWSPEPESTRQTFKTVIPLAARSGQRVNRSVSNCRRTNNFSPAEKFQDTQPHVESWTEIMFDLWRHWIVGLHVAHRPSVTQYPNIFEPTFPRGHWYWYTHTVYHISP